ncbi:DUF4190 domain-containing protein [Paenibacillus sanguinis]|uniref:DUF4190 domain-containing protein n=1 Tax=Paenibacillus sanguinis TaxID=225906 RepID=UPI0003629D46|nr:DUF4190 domain-containing protein [Paenibacillus sanguinis]
MFKSSPEGVNAKSVAALILGVLSLVIPLFGFILAIISIILARQASNEITRSNDAGKGLAIAGLACGTLTLSFYFLLLLNYMIYW